MQNIEDTNCSEQCRFFSIPHVVETPCWLNAFVEYNKRFTETKDTEYLDKALSLYNRSKNIWNLKGGYLTWVKITKYLSEEWCEIMPKTEISHDTLNIKDADAVFADSIMTSIIDPNIWKWFVPQMSSNIKCFYLKKAVVCGSVECVKLLLKHVSMKTYEEYIVKYQDRELITYSAANTDILSLLLKHGAKFKENSIQSDVMQHFALVGTSNTVPISTYYLLDKYGLLTHSK